MTFPGGGRVGTGSGRRRRLQRGAPSGHDEDGVVRFGGEETCGVDWQENRELLIGVWTMGRRARKTRWRTLSIAGRCFNRDP